MSWLIKTLSGKHEIVLKTYELAEDVYISYRGKELGVSIREVLAAVEYILTNSRLMSEKDERLEFVRKVSKMKVVGSFNTTRGRWLKMRTRRRKKPLK